MKKQWQRPVLTTMKAGAAETAVTGTANDTGTGSDPKRRS